MTSFVIVVTKARDRWFDLDAVRTEHKSPPQDTSTWRWHDTGSRADDGQRVIHDGHPAGAPPLDWTNTEPPPTESEREELPVGSARYLIGDVFDALATLEDHSVDLVFTSPPFLALRSYLPAEHPDKAKEIGSEATPADFLDTLLDVVEACDRVLAPHGSLCFELGDTYAGSGGAGGDYNAGGLRDGAPGFDGSARRWRSADGDAGKPQVKGSGGPLNRGGGLVPLNAGRGWPLDKSLCGIPTLFAWSLAYGRNLLRAPLSARQLLSEIEAFVEGMRAQNVPMTADDVLNTLRGMVEAHEEIGPYREREPWRIRNLVVWGRPNPPVGALGDKWRPASSYVTVACKARYRWFDLDAVRTGLSEHSSRYYMADSEHWQKIQGEGHAHRKRTGDRGDEGFQQTSPVHPAGAPPLDWQHADFPELLDLPTAPYPGSHYATMPGRLVAPFVDCMCPRQVCRTCGKPSERIVDSERVLSGSDNTASARAPGRVNSGVYTAHGELNRTTLGWTDCEHDNYRRGVVLDPFAGSGTTLSVATGMGRDAIGIDLDARNADLARERCGMFLGVSELSTEPAA